MRSTSPEASTVSASMSISWYLNDDEPLLTTSTTLTRDPPPCAWIAVIAMVLTMSSTSAPRERSLMGLFRPCSTGPIATAPAERCTAL